MNSDELDLCYTELCQALTDQGKERTELVLARFALLAMLEINEPNQVRELIRKAILEPLPTPSTTSTHL